MLWIKRQLKDFRFFSRIEREERIVLLKEKPILYEKLDSMRKNHFLFRNPRLHDSFYSFSDLPERWKREIHLPMTFQEFHKIRMRRKFGISDDQSSFSIIHQNIKERYEIQKRILKKKLQNWKKGDHILKNPNLVNVYFKISSISQILLGSVYFTWYRTMKKQEWLNSHISEVIVGEKMSLQEASRLLLSNPDEMPTIEELKQIVKERIEANDPNKGGSTYICQKIINAYAVIAEHILFEDDEARIIPKQILLEDVLGRDNIPDIEVKRKITKTEKETLTEVNFEESKKRILQYLDEFSKNVQSMNLFEMQLDQTEISKIDDQTEASKIGNQTEISKIDDHLSTYNSFIKKSGAHQADSLDCDIELENLPFHQRDSLRSNKKKDFQSILQETKLNLRNFLTSQKEEILKSRSRIFRE